MGRASGSAGGQWETSGFRGQELTRETDTDPGVRGGLGGSPLFPERQLQVGSGPSSPGSVLTAFVPPHTQSPEQLGLPSTEGRFGGVDIFTITRAAKISVLSRSISSITSLLTTHLHGDPAPAPLGLTLSPTFISWHGRFPCWFLSYRALTKLPGEQGVCSHLFAHPIPSPQPQPHAWHITGVGQVFVE